MKIQSLNVRNFIGIAGADLQMPEPVHLFAGKNASGKSSMRDAVALALTADLGRVSLKKGASQLIRDGADGACCEVATGDGDTYAVTISAAGKITDSQKGREPNPALQYVLDAQRFARLDATERRAFLYGLMGVKAGQTEIADRLIAKGCDDTKVQRVLPLLRAGFDAACKQAKAKATEAKGAWRAVTGETYGSEKAKSWRAPAPGHDAAAAKEVATELTHLDAAMESWQRQIGRLQAEEQRRAGLRARLSGLHEAAAKIQRIGAKLAFDEQQLAEWEADLTKTCAAAGTGPRIGLVHDLARAVAYLIVAWPANHTPETEAADAALSNYKTEYGEPNETGGDADARARLPEVQRSRDLLASAVANDRRDLEAAQRAHAEAQAIDAELAEAFDAAALGDAQEQAEGLRATRAELTKKLDAISVLKAQAEAAKEKTAAAAAHAADVAAWDAIGDALAPDGIPGEILAEALGPINNHLNGSAAQTGWMQAHIESDMTIWAAYGGASDMPRPYALLSESEKWRVDAMLAEAVAHLSGARLLVLDRFDVLDLAGRSQLLGWLDMLAETGQIDTAMVFGTLKALPSGLPSTIAVHWIENGVVGQLKEAA